MQACTLVYGTWVYCSPCIYFRMYNYAHECLQCVECRCFTSLIPLRMSDVKIDTVLVFETFFLIKVLSGEFLSTPDSRMWLCNVYLYFLLNRILCDWFACCLPNTKVLPTHWKLWQCSSLINLKIWESELYLVASSKWMINIRTT